MAIKSKFICLLLMVGHFALAQDADVNQIIQQIEQSNSGERIRSVCSYYDNNVHSRTPEKFDNFLTECYRIAERDNDGAFKAYLDFYKRISAVNRIPDDDPQVRETKMPIIMEEALSHYQALGDEHFIAICNAYIGHYHFILKAYEKSLEKLLIADEVFRKVGYNKFPDIGKHLHNMALVFFFFRHYDKVAELMEISAQTPPYNYNLHIQRYNTLGAAYTDLKQYEKAENAFIKTKETAMVYRDTFWIALAAQNIANIYLERGKYPEALQVYESNLKFIELYKNITKREYSQYLLGLAKTCVFLNDLPKARQYLDRINYTIVPNDKEPMFLFGTTYQDINYWVEFYDVQHRYQYARKEYKKAYHYSDSLYAIKYKVDSTFNGLEVQVAQNRIEARDKQYQNDKNEATIKNKNRQVILIGSLLGVIIIASVLLYLQNRKINSRNKIINQQLAELSRTLEQKQMLLSELQHRVKNNLQHVISILDIQKESVDFNNIDELIRGNQNRIHSMALLHTKLNVAESVNEVDLNRYVTELSELVKDSYDHHKKKISLTLKCEIEKMSIEKALPLGLIIVELVSNSMKHAFKKHNIGIIDIVMTKDENINKLYYADNGIGYDFHKLSEKGLGQEIIKGLIDQLNGKVESSNNNGFELNVYFK
jgi:two-component sensor histidine kinase